MTCPAWNRIARSIMCQTMYFSMKIMSPSTFWLNFVETLRDDWVCSPGFAQARHYRQVRTMSGMVSRTRWLTPAMCKVFCMAVAGACHHRRCSFRNARWTAESLPVLSTCSVDFMSNRVQSDACAVPLDELVQLRLSCRGCWSGPRDLRKSSSVATSRWASASPW